MDWLHKKAFGAGLLGIAFADLWLFIVERQFVPLLVPPFLCFFVHSPTAMFIVSHIVWFFYGVLLYFSWRFYIWPIFGGILHTSGDPKDNEKKPE